MDSREVKEWVALGGNDRKDMHIELVSHISCELHKQIVCGHKFTLFIKVDASTTSKVMELPRSGQ